MLIDPSIELVLKLGHFLGVPLNFCLELLNLGILLLQSLRDAVLPVLQIGDNGLLIHDLFVLEFTLIFRLLRLSMLRELLLLSSIS